jgi:hypothetical protein
MKQKFSQWKILLTFVAVLITIILFKDQIFGQVEKLTSEKLNNNKTCNYLDINDDDTILKNKFDYYELPNAQPKEQVSADLQKFLISYYPFPINSRTNACSQENPICSKDNSEFQVISFDLNSDGKKEYIVMPWEVCGCSMRVASGGGDTLIIRAKNNEYEVIGNFFNSNGYVISKNKTNKYYDILTNSHSSAASGTETLYKYQLFSNGGETNGKYEFAFSKWYDFTRINKK